LPSPSVVGLTLEYNHNNVKGLSGDVRVAQFLADYLHSELRVRQAHPRFRERRFYGERRAELMELATTIYVNNLPLGDSYSLGNRRRMKKSFAT